MSYHQFKDESGNEYGSVEVFYVYQDEIDDLGEFSKFYETGAGWYWWACFPGCLAESEPNGPFETEQDAIDDARAA